MTDEGDSDVVVVRRQWNDHREAVYPFKALAAPHWTQFSGGVRAPAPQPFIHGYVTCTEALAGEVAHSGLHGECPHHIKVCVVAKANTPAVMRRLREAAGPKP